MWRTLLSRSTCRTLNDITTDEQYGGGGGGKLLIYFRENFRAIFFTVILLITEATDLKIREIKEIERQWYRDAVMITAALRFTREIINIQYEIHIN